ncbi:MAG: DoxX family protein [Propionicimonas sp.]|nr:DoxX family protein [Propionicimonas sp.]
MTERNDPEPPVPTPEPGPHPDAAWAPETKPVEAVQPADEAESQHVLPDAGPTEGDPVEDAVEEGMPSITPDEPEPIAETVDAPAEPAASAPEPVADVSPAEPQGTPVPPPAVAEPPAGEPASESAQPAEATAATAPLFAPAPAAWGMPVPDVPVTPSPNLPSGPTTPTAPTDTIFRDAVVAEPTELDPLSAEAEKLAAERAARREAREAALTATAPIPVTAPEPVVVYKRTNDRFFGSLGLFLLRLVTAAIFLVRGLNLVTDIPAAQAQFATTIIPYPQVMAIVTGVACLLIALSLVLGLLTRVAGLGVLLIAGGALAFVLWGPWSPFVAGQPGFLGEYELLLAAVGLLFLLLGGGGWSVDRSFRAGRERDKAEQQDVG